MAARRYRDPAIRKLLEVQEEAKTLGLPQSIISGLQKVEDLHNAREAYCDSKTSAPSDAMAALMKDTLEHPGDIRPRMMSGNLEGYVLKFLVSSSKARRILEVGTFTGCGSLGMAEVLPDDGKVTTCELNQSTADLARTFLDRSPHGKKVEILVGRGTDTLKELANKGEKYDFVFIDADKDGYCDYFNICFNSLLAPGGTIAMDNALFGGSPYEPENPPNEGVTKFNNMIVTRDDVYYVLMPIRDGVMLIRRKADMNGRGTDTLKELANKGEKYDFVFIDADKDGYCDYFNICFDYLLAPGGTIAMDNALFGGSPYESENPPNEGVTKFNNMIVTRDDVYYVLMPIRDGVMLIRRKADMNGS